MPILGLALIILLIFLFIYFIRYTGKRAKNNKNTQLRAYFTVTYYLMLTRFFIGIAYAVLLLLILLIANKIKGQRR